MKDYELLRRKVAHVESGDVGTVTNVCKVNGRIQSIGVRMPDGSVVAQNPDDICPHDNDGRGRVCARCVQRVAARVGRNP